MVRSICLPVHESSQAAKARSIAAALAEIYGAQLTGLRTTDLSDKKRRLERLRDLLPEALRPSAVELVKAPPSRSDEDSLDIKTLEGSPLAALTGELETGDYDLMVLPATRQGEVAPTGMGSLCERLLRRSRVDTLVIKDGEGNGLHEPGCILVCIDGSQESYAGLRQALDLGKRFDKTVEAVGVYDPYLHYTLFNGIVNVLTAEASSVFKFADQEKLHEEIIDTGLAKIYQAHLEVAQKVAEDAGADIEITLLDGKAFQRVLRHVNQTRPWLMVMGRVGVHSGEDMDIGATSENLLRSVPCDVLVTSSRFMPPVDVQAEAAIEWTPSAEKKMERVPDFVKGVATMSIIRWAMEHGHSIITPSVINSAMGDLLPAGAAQAMGYVAEEAAIKQDNLLQGKTFLCPDCGYAARDYRPVACPVCRTEGPSFEQIDRATFEALTELEKGSLEEDEMFDGKKLKWTLEAKAVLRRVPSGYERRRAKARIEKTARVRGLTQLGQAFVVDMIEQELADTSYLSKKGDHVDIVVREEEKPDDESPRAREESPLPWTDAAWKRICRVPQGFMRDMTREKVEQFATTKELTEVNLALCEEGIAEGRRMMAEMLGQYNAGGPSQKAVRDASQKTAPAPEPATSPAPAEEDSPGWTAQAAEQVEEAVERVTEVGKFTEDRARDLSKSVSETRARERNLKEIGESFMIKLGKQLGYGHPLAKVTTDYEFEWTPEAEARLADIPEFCREMSRWRVEWTAVKKDLGRVITPEIMDVKFEMWGEVSDSILDRDEEKMEWDDEPMARFERIPEFIRGQVIQSVEGNARRLGFDRVTNQVLDKVIERWIETGDFHEGKYGYQ